MTMVILGTPDGAGGVTAGGATVPGPGSTGPGRTYVDGAQTIGSGSKQVGASVPAGRVLWVYSLEACLYNGSTSVVGDIRVLDGLGGAVKVPIGMPPAPAAGQPYPLVLSLAFPEPRQFLTAVYLSVVAGTIGWALSWGGYLD